MWAFLERRRSKRYKVDWHGSLHCVFPGSEENLQVRVVEVSMTGARLALERVQIGSHHLMVGNTRPELELSILLPEGLFQTPMEIHWYNWDEEERLFSVGVEFLSVGEENQSLLELVVRNI